MIVNQAYSYAATVMGAAQGKAGSIAAKMSQQAQVLANLKNTLELSNQQLASFYFYEQFDPSLYASVNMNMQFPSYINCLFD